MNMTACKQLLIRYDSTYLVVTSNIFVCKNFHDAFHFLGHPEGDLALAQAVAYLALAPKSNAVYTAFHEVAADVANTAADPVPLHLRNAPTGLMKGLGYGAGYQYAHALESKVADMQCLPDNLKDRTYYNPTAEGYERELQKRMEEITKAKAATPTITKKSGKKQV